MTHEKKQNPPKYWNDFSRVEEALLLFIAPHGTPGIMPTRGELKAAGRGDLAAAIDRHGGFDTTRCRRRGQTATGKNSRTWCANSVQWLQRLGCQKSCRRKHSY